MVLVVNSRHYMPKQQMNEEERPSIMKHEFQELDSRT